MNSNSSNNSANNNTMPQVNQDNISSVAMAPGVEQGADDFWECQHQGVLQKRRDVFQNRWRPRWFVLIPKQGLLKYYLSSSDNVAATAGATMATAAPNNTRQEDEDDSGDASNNTNNNTTNTNNTLNNNATD